MTDDITSLFDNATPAPTADHREQVWQRLMADANASPDSSTVAGVRTMAPPTQIAATAGVGGTFELEAISAEVIPLPKRRPIYLALAAASILSVSVAGIAANNRSAHVRIQPSQPSEVATTTAIATTLPPTTPPATTVPASTAPASTVPPTSAVTTTVAVTTTAPAATTTAPTTVVPKTTSTAVSPTSTLTFDAATLGKAKGTVVATFDGAVVGDIYTRLSRTPEGGIYYAGFSADRNSFFVQFFADGPLPSARFDVPATFLRKSAKGANVYDGWVAGPERVLYGMKWADDGKSVTDLVAMPTTGANAGSVVITKPVSGSTGCGRSIKGMSCTGFTVTQPWVDTTGRPTGKSYPDMPKIDVPDDRTEAIFSTMLTNDAIEFPLGAQKDRPITISNLRTWANATDLATPLGAQFHLARRNDVDTCVIGNVGWENSNRSFALCVATDGDITTTTFGTPMSSLPGGTLAVSTANAYFTVEPSGARFNLIRYDF
jgi:hypothetical protein